MFVPPLGGNGKSDISYLVNGERWRERRTKRERDGRKMESDSRAGERERETERGRLHLINLVMQSKYTV